MTLIDFNELAEDVRRVQNTIAKDDAVEIFTFLCFRDGRLSSFDGQAGTKTKTVLKESFCVEGRKFVTLMGTLRGRQGTISINHEKGWMHVDSGNFDTKLPIFSTDEFPEIMVEKDTQIYCDAPNLVDALKAVRGFVEKGEDSPLAGVGFNGRHVYSSDEKRVTRALLASPVPTSVSVSRSAVDQLTRLGQPKYLFRSGSNIGAIYPALSTVFLARCLEKTYPYEALDEVFTRHEERSEVPIPEGLRDALDRVTALMEDDEKTLHVEVTQEFWNLETLNQVGMAYESVPTSKGLAGSVKFKVNADSFGSVLRKMKPTALDLADLVVGPGHMLVFRGPGFENAMGLLA